MSTVESVVRRPQRWDTPFGSEMTEAHVDRLLGAAPFSQMDASRFPKTCSLRGILRHDARLLHLLEGDIVVREGDYGNSAFLILEGAARVILESLPEKLLGRTQRAKKSVFRTAIDQLFGRPRVEVRRYGAVELDGQLGQRQDGSELRIFLQDVPGVLDRHQSLGLGVGEFFGELAAITRTPRSATVVATENTTLVEIRWQGLRDLMRNDLAIKNQIETLYRKNSLETHLRETDLLSRVPAEGIREIAAATEFESYGKFAWNAQYKKVSQQAPSERIKSEPVIAEEGSIPDSLIMIRSGFARLSRRYGSGHRTLAYLGKGQTFCFGELAAETQVDSPVALQNSLRAVGYVDILRIPKALIEKHVLPTWSEKELARAAKHILKNEDRPKSAAIVEESAEETSALMEFLLDERLMNGTNTMLINTDRCTRCDDCLRACASTHDHNPRFIRHGPQFDNVMVANACMHCVDPVCMIGCPTGAISRDADSGNVLINDLTCIGCATCANSCPYSNIRMVETRSPSGEMIIDLDSGKPIVKATKCDLCADSWGGPACQRACPHDAMVRLDLSDSSAISRWLKHNQ